MKLEGEKKKELWKRGRKERKGKVNAGSEREKVEQEKVKRQ